MNKRELAEFEKKYQDVPKERGKRLAKLIKDLKIKDKELDSLVHAIKRLRNAKWETIHFIINFTPQATPRPRSGRGGIFYVKGAADNMKLFKEFLEDMNDPYDLITTPCRINVDSYFPIPTGMNRVEKILAEIGLICPISKPDWDNIGKTYSDMIQKSLLHEDCLIIDGRSRKFYSSLPRVEVTLQYMKHYDCKFHKKKIENWKASKDIELEEKETIV